jgi:uncharacterized protein (TIGR03086 family)
VGANPAVTSGAALDLFIDAVEQTPQQNWDQPSNLEGWSVRDLVGHATGTAAKLVALVEDGEIGRSPSRPADWICEDPAGRLRELATRLAEVLPSADLTATRPSPQGGVSLLRALTFVTSDLAIHSWDLHRSQGRLIELPDDLLTLCRRLVDSVPEDMLRRPGGFGPARSAPADSTPTALLMAHLGRSVDS